MDQTPSVRLGYTSVGEKSGALVVFIHGFGGRRDSWGDLQQRIAKFAPTLAFDLPGHGQSVNYPDFGPPKVAARAIIAELHRMGHDKVHVVGHSMGGAVSSLIALFQPKLVASLTLLAPGGFGTEINFDILNSFISAQSKEQLADTMQLFYGPDAVFDDGIAEEQFEQLQLPGARDALRHIAGIVFKGGVQGTLPLADIGRLGIPIDVIWGTLDKIIPVDQAAGLPPGFNTHIFSGVGHMPAEEIPDEVERLIAAKLG